ncbi:hypothetical protein SVIOM342S_10448 [Streptomyces violaceorubidus]
MWAGLTRVGLPSFTEGVVHRRHGLDGLHHRVADQVREGDLPAPGALEVVVDDDAVVEQQLHRDRAHGRGRGQLQRGVHVLRDRGGRAAQGHQLGPLRGGAGVLGGRRGGLACGLPAGLAGAGAAAGFAAGAAGAGAAGCAGAGAAAFGWAGAGACACGAGGGRWRAAGVRGHRGGRRLRRRSGLVVGEEVPPGSVHGVRVLEVLLIDLVDEPLIGTERGRGVLSALFAWSVSVRMLELLGDCGDTARTALFRFTRWWTAGIRGYAYRPPKVRLGRSIVARKSHRGPRSALEMAGNKRGSVA